VGVTFWQPSFNYFAPHTPLDYVVLHVPFVAAADHRRPPSNVATPTRHHHLLVAPPPRRVSVDKVLPSECAVKLVDYRQPVDHRRACHHAVWVRGVRARARRAAWASPSRYCQRCGRPTMCATIRLDHGHGPESAQQWGLTLFYFVSFK
jgi:hypothetical protein